MKKNNRVKTVAVIPAYNEESSIAKVILRVKRYVDEVIVCDDGSTDMTFMIAKALGASVVRHGERRGKGEALRTLSKEVMELGSDIIVVVAIALHGLKRISEKFARRFWRWKV